MSGKNPRLNPLELQKLLLLAESELNRAQLVQEWQTISDGVHAIKSQARIFSSLAATAASLFAILAAIRRKKSAPAAEKLSWLQTILKGVQLAGSLWPAFRPQRRGQKEK
jgi:hypothetical protein